MEKIAQDFREICGKFEKKNLNTVRKCEGNLKTLGDLKENLREIEGYWEFH